MTQKAIITKYLESIPNQWVKSYDLRGKATQFGFSGHQADRRARELAEAGLIDVRHSGKYAEYRAKVKGMSMADIAILAADRRMNIA